tara:strand:+ start:473 stop:664 length:192 start_codon:yes stop_codon:yes gene_type:complete
MKLASLKPIDPGVNGIKVVKTVSGNIANTIKKSMFSPKAKKNIYICKLARNQLAKEIVNTGII